MKAASIILLLSCCHFGFSQKVTPISLEDLKSEMTDPSNELRVYNFWASWCAPCIKEMPYFQELSKDTKVTLVSLDFVQDIKKAEGILSKKNIELSSYLLTEEDADKYISAISNSWSGAIPATVIISADGKRHFFEQSFEKEELMSLVESIK